MQAKIQVADMLPFFQQHLLRAILLGRAGRKPATNNSLLQMGVKNPDYCSLLVLGRDFSANISFDTQQTILLTVENIVRYHLCRDNIEIRSALCDQDFLWVITCEAPQKVADVLFPIFENARAVIEKSSGIQFSFAISDTAVSWQELHGVYLNLQRTVWLCSTGCEAGVFRSGESGLLVLKEPEDDFVLKVGVARNRAQILQEYLEKGLRDHFETQLKEICSILLGVRGHSSHAMELFLLTNAALLSHVNKNGLTEVIPRELSLGPHFAPGELDGWPQRVNYLNELAAAIFSVGDKKSQDNIETSILRIKEYIMGSLSEDLSLTLLGQISGFNPAYLSRAFKQNVGMGIHEYTSNCRMQLAVSLLNNTKLKIYEIAAQCGYNNITHFNKAFKAFKGASPQKFREGS